MGIKGGDLVARCHCRTRWRIDNRQNRLRGGYWKGAAKRNVEGGKAWPTIPQRAVLLTSIEEDSNSAPEHGFPSCFVPNHVGSSESGCKVEPSSVPQRCSLRGERESADVGTEHSEGKVAARRPRSWIDLPPQ